MDQKKIRILQRGEPLEENQNEGTSNLNRRNVTFGVNNTIFYKRDDAPNTLTDDIDSMTEEFIANNALSKEEEVKFGKNSFISYQIDDFLNRLKYDLNRLSGQYHLDIPSSIEGYQRIIRNLNEYTNLLETKLAQGNGDEYIEKLETVNDFLGGRIDYLEEKNKREKEVSNEKVSKLEAEIQRLELECERLNEDIAQEVEDYEPLLDHYNEYIKDRRAEINKLNAELYKTDADYDLLHEDYRKLKEQIATQPTNQQEEINRLNQENGQLNTDFLNLQEKMLKLQAQSEEKQRVIDKNKNEIATLEEVLTNLSDESANKGQEIAQKGLEIAKLQKRVTQLEQQLLAKDSEYQKRMKNLKENTDQQINGLKATNKRLTEVKGQLEQNIAQEKKTILFNINKHKNHIKQKDDTITDLQAQLKEAKKEIALAKEEKESSIESQLAELNKKINEAQDQLAKLTGDLKEVQAKFYVLYPYTALLQGNLEKLKEELKEEDKNITAVESLTKQKNELQDSLKAVIKEIVLLQTTSRLLSKDPKEHISSEIEQVSLGKEAKFWNTIIEQISSYADNLNNKGELYKETQEDIYRNLSTSKKNKVFREEDIEHIYRMTNDYKLEKEAIEKLRQKPFEVTQKEIDSNKNHGSSYNYVKLGSSTITSITEANLEKAKQTCNTYANSLREDETKISSLQKELTNGDGEQRKKKAIDLATIRNDTMKLLEKCRNLLTLMSSFRVKGELDDLDNAQQWYLHSCGTMSSEERLQTLRDKQVELDQKIKTLTNKISEINKPENASQKIQEKIENLESEKEKCETEFISLGEQATQLKGKIEEQNKHINALEKEKKKVRNAFMAQLMNL